MSTLNVPKCILFSPAQEERNDDPSLAALKSTKNYEIIKTNQDSSMQELHQNRLKSLRKELDHLKETAWKYEPIEMYIGQSAQQF